MLFHGFAQQNFGEKGVSAGVIPEGIETVGCHRTLRSERLEMVFVERFQVFDFADAAQI